MINAESELKSNESKCSSETWSQSSESYSNYTGLTDRLTLFKLFIDGLKTSKLFTLYYVLFLIFFSYNASYYIEPRFYPLLLLHTMLTSPLLPPGQLSRQQFQICLINLFLTYSTHSQNSSLILQPTAPVL